MVVHIKHLCKIQSQDNSVHNNIRSSGQSEKSGNTIWCLYLSILAYTMISIRTSSIDVFRYMRVPHFTYAKLPEAEGTSRCTVCSEVVKHASNASNHFKINACSMHILLSLDSSQHESSSCNMYYTPWCVCMCMLSTYSSCIATSLLLSISIEKVSYRQC